MTRRCSLRAGLSRAGRAAPRAATRSAASSAGAATRSSTSPATASSTPRSRSSCWCRHPRPPRLRASGCGARYRRCAASRTRTSSRSTTSSRKGRGASSSWSTSAAPTCRCGWRARPARRATPPCAWVATWPRRSPRRTGAASCIATSSRRTSCSIPTAERGSPTSARPSSTASSASPAAARSPARWPTPPPRCWPAAAATRAPTSTRWASRCTTRSPATCPLEPRRTFRRRRSPERIPTDGAARPRLPAWLDDVVAHATAAAAEDRFPTAASLDEALARPGAAAGLLVNGAGACVLCAGPGSARARAVSGLRRLDRGGRHPGLSPPRDARVRAAGGGAPARAWSCPRWIAASAQAAAVGERPVFRVPRAGVPAPRAGAGAARAGGAHGAGLAGLVAPLPAKAWLTAGAAVTAGTVAGAAMPFLLWTSPIIGSLVLIGARRDARTPLVSPPSARGGAPAGARAHRRRDAGGAPGRHRAEPARRHRARQRRALRHAGARRRPARASRRRSRSW